MSTCGFRTRAHRHVFCAMSCRRFLYDVRGGKLAVWRVSVRAYWHPSYVWHTNTWRASMTGWLISLAVVSICLCIVVNFEVYVSTARKASGWGNCPCIYFHPVSMLLQSFFKLFDFCFGARASEQAGARAAWKNAKKLPLLRRSSSAKARTRL